jgi:hypothetical protein
MSMDINRESLGHLGHGERSDAQSWSRDSFAIKYNNCSANGVCPICGRRTDPQIPLAIFLKDSYQEICDECVEQYAPEMRDALAARAGVRVEIIPKIEG